MTTDAQCARCGRVISIDDPAYLEWEPIGPEGDEQTCGGCLTPEEQQAIYEADATLLDTVPLEDPSDPRSDPL